MELTLQEEAYCQMRATGETKRAAYRKAFGASGIDVKESTVDTAVNRLEKRAEIVRRIGEIRTDYNAEMAETWAKRKEEVCEAMFSGIVDAANGRIAKGKDSAMTVHDAVKTIGMLADLKGWREAEKIELGGTGAIDPGEVNRKLDLLLKKSEEPK